MGRKKVEKRRGEENEEEKEDEEDGEGEGEWRKGRLGL